VSATPAGSKASFFDRLRTLDRRWLFLVMGLAIVIPIFFPIGLPALPGDATVDTYDAVNNLKDGSRVFISMDFDPASRPELEPFARSVLVQLKRKRCKIVIVSLWEYAPPLVNGYVRSILQAPLNPDGPADDPLNKIYERKTDYIFLGFKAGKQVVINNLVTSMTTAYPTSQEGEPVGEIPIMQGIRTVQDFKDGGILILISAGFPGAKEYVQYLSPYNLPMVVSTTAVSRTDLQPYYSSGQLLGLVAGMQGSAEYEQLVNPPGEQLGKKGLDVLNIGTLVIILAILLGNAIYFMERRQQKRSSSGGAA